VVFQRVLAAYRRLCRERLGRTQPASPEHQAPCAV
jgi:hypothetical protein